MSVAGKWRIAGMPGFPADYPDLVELEHFQNERNRRGFPLS